jgi:hypothetical protein
MSFATLCLTSFIVLMDEARMDETLASPLIAKLHRKPIDPVQLGPLTS